MSISIQDKEFKSFLINNSVNVWDYSSWQLSSQIYRFNSFFFFISEEDDKGFKFYRVENNKEASIKTIPIHTYNICASIIDSDTILILDLISGEVFEISIKDGSLERIYKQDFSYDLSGVCDELAAIVGMKGVTFISYYDKKVKAQIPSILNSNVKVLESINSSIILILKKEKDNISVINYNCSTLNQPVWSIKIKEENYITAQLNRSILLVATKSQSENFSKIIKINIDDGRIIDEINFEGKIKNIVLIHQYLLIGFLSKVLVSDSNTMDVIRTIEGAFDILTVRDIPLILDNKSPDYDVVNLILEDGKVKKFYVSKNIQQMVGNAIIFNQNYYY
jgi:hypothetical protein